MLFSRRADCVDRGSRPGCLGAHKARFDMEEEKKSESSLHFSSGFLFGGHEAILEQSQATGTRQSSRKWSAQ